MGQQAQRSFPKRLARPPGWISSTASFMADGGLASKLIQEDGVTGVTSNPSIFEKAMGHGEAYDGGFNDFDNGRARCVSDGRHLRTAQAIADIKAAACGSTLRPFYDRLDAQGWLCQS